MTDVENIFYDIDNNVMKFVFLPLTVGQNKLECWFLTKLHAKLIFWSVARACPIQSLGLRGRFVVQKLEPTTALGVTKFITITAMNLVTLCYPA